MINPGQAVALIPVENIRSLAVYRAMQLQVKDFWLEGTHLQMLGQ